MVQACGRLLILCGDTYCQRLWCVWELYTWFAMSGVDAAKRTTIVNVKRPAHEAARLEHLKQQLQASRSDGDGAAGVSDAEVLAAEAANALQQEDEEAPAEELEGSDDWDGVSALVDFDVKEAHCFSQEDEAKLRRVIESESAETFNNAIREAGEALLDAAESGTLRASRIARPGKGAGSAGDTGGAVSVENPVAGAGAGADTAAESAPDKALRLEFQTLDANSDGRLCRQDLQRAFGGDGSGKGWFGEAQVDELLKCIATAQPRILVNGSLSIGLPEYKEWVRRAR